MFDRNMLTFNPGWDQPRAGPGRVHRHPRLQRRLKEAGIEFTMEVDESGSGPGSFIVVDPDGNPMLFDQHR